MKEETLFKIYKELDREELIRIAIKDKKRAENLRRELEKAIRRSKSINKENERLKELCNKYEEEHKTTFEEWKKTINIINELEKYLIEEIEDYEKQIKYHKKNKDLRSGILDLVGEYEGEKVCFEDMLGKLQELKGSNNNE